MKNLQENAKAWATLIGGICVGLLAVYTGDTEIGKGLTVVAVICSSVVTWAVRNKDKPFDIDDDGHHDYDADEDFVPEEHP